MWNRTIILGVLVFAGFACVSPQNSKEGPQKVLSEYVTKSFAVKNVSDKALLMQYTTGEVKKALNELDEKSFNTAFIHTKREFKSLKIKDERQVSEGKYSITYELTYNAESAPITGTEPQKDEITNKKTAIFEMQDGKWLISEVRSIKTLIDHKNDITF